LPGAPTQDHALLNYHQNEAQAVVGAKKDRERDAGTPDCLTGICPGAGAGHWRAPEGSVPMIESFLFGRDHRQALRIGRLLIATSSYFLALFVVYCCSEAGLMRSAYAMLVLVSAIFIHLVFYFAIRSGLSMYVRDPSLTIPQVTVAMLANSYLVYHGGTARAVFLIAYLAILAFATLRLRPRQIVITGSLAAMIYGAIIGFEFFTQKDGSNVLVEILQWLVLLSVAPWFALVAGHIRNARRQLTESNEKLVAATREHEVALRTIQEQATRDELTGLFNRRYMADALRQESSRTDRTHEPFCILMLDVDHFKKINDCVGHIGGDNVLIAVTAAIAAQLRSIDHFSRHGGEEFLVLMPSTSLEAALHAADRIRKCIEDTRISEGDQVLSVTLSIGVSEYRAGGSVEAMLADADRALYRAKHNGRNCVEYSRTPAPPSRGMRTA
jgi:diguanylate cyclase (GGDEF)-like protein